MINFLNPVKAELSKLVCFTFIVNNFKQILSQGIAFPFER
jgi:hypothetical protein